MDWPLADRGVRKKLFFFPQEPSNLQLFNAHMEDRCSVAVMGLRQDDGELTVCGTSTSFLQELENMVDKAEVQELIAFVMR